MRPVNKSRSRRRRRTRRRKAPRCLSAPVSSHVSWCVLLTEAVPRCPFPGASLATCCATVSVSSEGLCAAPVFDGDKADHRGPTGQTFPHSRAALLTLMGHHCSLRVRLTESSADSTGQIDQIIIVIWKCILSVSGNQSIVIWLNCCVFFLRDYGSLLHIFVINV